LQIVFISVHAIGSSSTVFIFCVLKIVYALKYELIKTAVKLYTYVYAHTFVCR